MRLSCSSRGLEAAGLATLVETAARAGCEGVELDRVGGDPVGPSHPAFAGAALGDATRRLQDAGLHVACVVSRGTLDDARAGLELAERLGATAVRVSIGAVDDLQRLSESAGAAGVEVWLEAAGARDALARLERVASERLGIAWDPAAAGAAGEAPGDGRRQLGRRLRSVQLPSADAGAADVLALLQAAGYDGWVALAPGAVGWAAARLRGPRTPPAPPARARTCARMTIEIHADRGAMGRAAAREVAAAIRALVAREGQASVIFASAPSQNEFLQALRDDPALDWRRVVAFHLDEYVAVPPDHPASFRRFLRDRLFDHVPVRAFHGLDGQAPDLAAECERYAALLRAQPPGLAILGVGENGHLAFIDPPFCDFADPQEVRQVELDDVCRQQQVNDGGFARLEDVPHAALSLTIPRLLHVPRAVAIVPGPAKRAAIQAAVDGPVTRACPASVLRRHRDATLYLDEASAEWLDAGA